LRNLFYLAWLCTLALWPSSLKAECPVTATGLCTPGVEETIVIDEVETIEYEADGYTVTTDTTTTTTTVTTTNPDSGDILDGDNDYVSSKYEGDMDIDWGGQGPASMPSGNSCYNLGADKCAQITGSGNSTSTMGVSGMGTTFINTVDISELDIENGGRTNYTIKVDKRDAQDRIYMHITGKDGNTSVFSGTDILSESGVASGFQEYTGGWDFSGSITTIIVEVGGRDINLAIGPLFDDVTVNVLYNVVNTIITEHILSVEMWVAYGGSTETEVIDIVENIFEHNDVIESPGDDMYFEPEFDEPDMEMSYETVEYEMEMDFEMDFDMEMDFEMPDIDMEEMEIATIEYEMEMEMELDMPDMEMPEPEMEMAELDMDMPEPEMDMDMDMDMEMPEPDMETEVEVEPEMEEPSTTEPESEPEPETEPEEVKDEPTEEPTEETTEDVAEEPEAEESVSEAAEDEGSEDDMDKTEDKAKDKEEIKKEQKQKAAKKIVKKMGDKGKYDSVNQMKTLIVMQVLGNTKNFFESQKTLNDREGFFTDITLPDTVISDNNIAGYFLFAGSDGLINDMVDSQWQK
jgi:outer membrane biosynthesis protein TonB